MIGHSEDFPMIMEVEASRPNCPPIPPGTPPVSVGFGLYPLLDPIKTAEAGHDVYAEVEHVKIAIPGDQKSLYFQPATEQHIARFPQAYAHFKNRARTPVEGMPIEQWAGVNRAMALTLKAANVPTVEALAAVHDGHIDKFGTEGRALRAKAQAFLAQAKDGAETARLAADKAALQEQLEAMQRQISALTANSLAAGNAVAAAAQGSPEAARKPRARATS